MNVRWFNASSPFFGKTMFGKYVFVRLWNLFNRRTKDGEHFWGIGVLQVGNRHLAYIGHGGTSFLFMGKTE